MNHEAFMARLAEQVAGIAGPAAKLKDALEYLHRGFTTGRGRRAPDYLVTPRDAKAYLALSGLTNAARASFVLHRHRLALGEGERALDVGCGVGVTALALAARSHPKSEIVLVDQSEPALELAQKLFAKLFPDGPRVKTRKADLARDAKALPGGTFAVTMAGHVLNELHPRRGRDPGPARDLAVSLAKRSGTLVITEPAQRVPARALARIRGALLEAKFGILGPCPHSGRCPTLAPGAKDWCVVDVPFQRPPVVADVDGVLDLERTRLTVTYLAVSKSARDPRGGVLEVLSEPMRGKHGTVIYLCGARGRVALTLPTPPKSPLYRGNRIRLPKGAKPSGKDKSGAPRIRVGLDEIERVG
ncbi:MAG: small ribosomal subunit Rsm22 family protein [Planctomycetota bacterium]